MTIFDLPTLNPENALALAQATIQAHPILAQIYDDAFLVNLIRRRAAYDNLLLLRLVEPDDEMSAAYWDEIAGELQLLEPEGSVDAFRAKLRKHDGPSMDSARTELFFAALMKQLGARIVLEPEVGTRRCEFMAETTLQTWWEIKTPLDLPELQRDAAVQSEVQRRLRSIDQPYVLSLRAANLTPQQVPDAFKQLKRELYAYYREGGRPPRVFDVNGLCVAIDSMTTRPKGYLGTMTGKPYVFENEQSAHVVRRIIAAADQIPDEGGGIVVIDRSSSDWIHHHDIVDACFGEEQGAFHNGQFINVRLPGGVFDDRSAARVSAVISYTRRWREHGTLMTVMHNPSATIELPAGFLIYDGVRHTRRIPSGDGFRFVTTPDCEDED